MTSTRQRRLAYLSWITVCIVWGTTYLGIRVCLETMPPMLMGGFRWLVAGALLAAYVVATGESLPGRQRWGGIALLGFLMLALGNGGVVIAEQWVPSGLAAVVVASNPFWMSAVEAAIPGGERLRAKNVIGLIIGFTGIVVLVWPDLTLGAASRRGFLAGVVALQLASIGWSLGSAYSRRHARTDHLLGTTACQMLAGGIFMTAAGTIRGEWSHLWFSATTTWSLVYLSTVGAIGGFVAYTYALRHLPVSFVSLYAYINPIIAVTLGVLILHESFDSRMAVAAALVFCGVAIVRWSGPKAVSDSGLEVDARAEPST
ncbi:MAG TPA: EamA family transporter [Vicinamibacterales bacterium]|nr:EamA family transporter [Vicinamibacterales bacterium]